MPSKQIILKKYLVLPTGPSPAALLLHMIIMLVCNCHDIGLVKSKEELGLYSGVLIKE